MTLYALKGFNIIHCRRRSFQPLLLGRIRSGHDAGQPGEQDNWLLKASMNQELAWPIPR